MRVYIWSDEAYPVYSITPREEGDNNKGWVDITDELYNRYLSICKEYDKIQEELAKYYV